ncbi:MAG: DoxX family protein [Sphingorhabdus sp.]
MPHWLRPGNATTLPFVRNVLRVVLAAFYLAAGVMHLNSPVGFLAITPEWVPYPQAVVAFTGVAEIAGALGILIPRTRKAAGIGLALYALCVWPANINHAINDIAIGGRHMGPWYHWPRLALQPVFIWLALWVTQVVEWPFRKSR